MYVNHCVLVSSLKFLLSFYPIFTSVLLRRSVGKCSLLWVILYSIIHLHMHNCMRLQTALHMHGLCTKSQNRTCILYIYKTSGSSFSSLLFSHITKEIVSPEILLLQLQLWNTIQRSSWWRGNCCKIQLEVYGNRWRWIPLSVILFLFFSLT